MTLGNKAPSEVSTKILRIAQLAKEHPEWALTTLAYAIDIEFLREAYKRTRKDGAPGIDGQTAEEYAVNLEENLASLLERFKSGTYRAPPVKRVNIPKGDGRTRAIGMPTFEDKILQRAVAMVLEPVYEQDFLSCSYGYRPGLSAHDALQALWQNVMSMNAGCVVIEFDIEGFFDALDHDHLRRFLDQRVKDGVIRRVIGKWLQAGVLEEAAYRQTEKGTPQGGVVSPILANIYLHEVLDVWFEREVKPRMSGPSSLIRYADDGVIVLSNAEDARRLMEVLPKRFAKYGLRLHSTKTRVVRFGRPKGSDGDDEGPGSFDFLGFTHFWDKSRRGSWVVRRKTSKSRLTRSLQRIREWCQKWRHLPVSEQHEVLSRKLRGHYGYYGITGNMRSLSQFARAVHRTWRTWLDRRSQSGHMTWLRFNRLTSQYRLPRPRIVHSVNASGAKP